MPSDRSADSAVKLKGLEFKYEETCSLAAVENHKNAIQAQIAEKLAQQEAEAKLLQKKRRAI